MYKKFEELLKERGLTAADVSRATGIAQTVFSNWKTRNGNLSFENIVKVAAFLEVPLETFAKQEV